MEFSKLVDLRRSVRKYTKDPVSREDIEEILECVRLAPSWKNSQTGRYYIALSDEAIAKVYESLPSFNQNSSANAAYILSSFKKGISGSLKPQEMSEEGDLWGAYDLGMANAYLILKARELGYDTLIMGIRDEKLLRDYFAIPEDEILLPVIAIGKGDGEPRLNKRKEVTEISKIK